MGFWDFLTGKEDKYKYKSNLSPEQEKLLSNLQNSLSNQGAGGAFGETADYYRNLLNLSPEQFEKFSAPAKRQFNEEIIPGLSEQFAGMGSGALSSSGFRNSAVQAGTDLSERLASLRENIKMQGAQGLQNLGQLGLGNYGGTVLEQGGPGFLETAAPIIGAGVGAAFGGPGGAMAGWNVGSGAGNIFSTKGKSSPFGKTSANAAATGGLNIGRPF